MFYYIAEKLIIKRSCALCTIADFNVRYTIQIVLTYALKVVFLLKSFLVLTVRTQIQE